MKPLNQPQCSPGIIPGTHQSDSDGALGDHGFIWKVNLKEGTKARYAAFPKGPPSGLGWLPDGRMLAVHTSGLRELQVETAVGSGVFVQYCDLEAATGQGSGRTDDFLNDMVVGFDGTAYVDVEFNFYVPEAAGPRDIAMVSPDGKLAVQAGSQCIFPNGAMITPDGKTYIVAETFAAQLSAFDIGEDGSLSNKRVWADLRAAFHKNRPGYPDHFAFLPDGCCLDAEGCVWAAVPACDPTMSTEFTGGFVRVAEGGEIK